MEIIQFNMNGSGQPDIAESVYDSLTGNLIEACRLPWVENIFIPGHPCHESYARMWDAYLHLLTRLQEDNEDPDAEEMISSLLEHGKIIALEMFRYGQEYQKMLNKG